MGSVFLQAEVCIYIWHTHMRLDLIAFTKLLLSFRNFTEWDNSLTIFEMQYSEALSWSALCCVGYLECQSYCLRVIVGTNVKDITLKDPTKKCIIKHIDLQHSETQR